MSHDPDSARSTDNPKLSDNRRVGNDRFAGFTRRIVAAQGRRIGDDGDVEALAEMMQLQRFVEASVLLAGWRLHEEHGYSWTEIARRLGISRQAARQRFGK